MDRIAIVTLWGFVITSGILMGGAIFETIVTQPMYFGDLPHSVTSWTHGSIQKPFFQLFTPLWSLLAVMTAVFAFAMPPETRLVARLVGVAGLLVMVSTIAFFVPILQRTEANGGAGLSGAEITRLAKQFAHWNYLRMGVLVAAWIGGLRTLVIASR